MLFLARCWIIYKALIFPLSDIYVEALRVVFSSRFSKNICTNVSFQHFFYMDCLLYPSNLVFIKMEFMGENVSWNVDVDKGIIFKGISKDIAPQN